jgi:hypothetical protein
VAPDHGRVEVLQQPDAVGAASGVRRQLEEVDRVRDRQRAGEVGEEDRARLERRDQQRLEACVRGSQLRAELADTPSELVPGQVDLPDRVPVGRERRR